MVCPSVREILHSPKLEDYLHVQAGKSWRRTDDDKTITYWNILFNIVFHLSSSGGLYFSLGEISFYDTYAKSKCGLSLVSQFKFYDY